MEPVTYTYVAAYYYGSTEKVEQLVVYASNETEALLKVVAHWNQFVLSSYNGRVGLVYANTPKIFVDSRFSMIRLP